MFIHFSVIEQQFCAGATVSLSLTSYGPIFVKLFAIGLENPSDGLDIL